MSTTMTTGKGVLKGGEHIPRVNPAEFFITVEGKKLTALDIAKEAVTLQSQILAVGQLERDFSTHMLMLASTCQTADDFSILCENVAFDMNWGRSNPAPKTWVVYRSTIFKAWKDYGVKPLEEMEIPQVKGNKLVLDTDEQPVKQTVIISGINQIKKASQALRLEQGIGAEDEEPEERRNPLRVLVDSFSKAREGVDKDASLVFQALIRFYVDSDDTTKNRVLRALKRVTTELKVPVESMH